jgi:hypothetical protein
VFIKEGMSSATLLREIETAPEEIRREVWDFLSFLKSRRMTVATSNPSMQSIDWSDLASRWNRVWGQDFAPGTPVDAILSDLRSDS